MDNSKYLKTKQSTQTECNNQSLDPDFVNDPITGLYPLDAFSHQLDQLIAATTYARTSLTLMLLQLANFYEIRNWIGKNEANFLLNDLARLLEKTVPADSMLCRCHNHEFAVLLIDEGSRMASRIVDNIKLALQNSDLQSIPPQLNMKCAVGLTAISEYTPRSEVAFARARHSLSEHQSLSENHNLSENNSLSENHNLSENNSRSGNQSYQKKGESEGLYASLTPQQSNDLLSKLGSAITKNHYRLNFQATVSFTEDGLRRYELRTSLVDKESNLPARVFLETVIQNALGVELDRWVIEQAITLLLADPDDNLHLTINLTQNSLVSPSFLDWLKSTASNPSPVFRNLVLQVSELDVLIVQHHLESFCHAVDSFGARLCISHFGSTNDPMRYLPLLKTHFVKLDHSLIRLAAIDRNRNKHLTELVRDIHDRGIKVIAPMIEQVQELPPLWEAGVDFVQGYCLHKPGTQLKFEFVKNQELSVT